MIKSLYSGVTGLRTHNQRMDVIGNNIANVNTTAYKAGTVTFKDVYYQTRQNASGGSYTEGGVNPIQVGYGVQLGTISKVMTQSGLTYSDSVFDCALEGSGFFQVMDPSGNIFYTRLGRFDLDDFGNLVDPNGNIVLGISGDPTNVAAGSQRINIAIPDVPDQAAQAIRQFMIGNVPYEIIVSAGDFGPGGNIAMTFIQSDAPFATMSGNTLNIFMDLSYDYETDAVANLGGRPVAGQALNAEQAEALGDPALDTVIATAAHVALWEQALAREVSRLFSADMNYAVELGGVNADPALVGGSGLSVEFVQLPTPTAAQNAYNSIRMPTTVAGMNTNLPTVVGELRGLYDTLVGNPAGTTTTGTAPAMRVLIAEHYGISIPQGATDADITDLINAHRAAVAGTLTFTVTDAGSSGNKYEVNIVTDAAAAAVTARWRDNIMTITLPPTAEVTLEEIQAAIEAAGRYSPTTGEPLIQVSSPLGGDPASVMITGQGIGPNTTLRVGMGRGEDSFFQSAFRSLSTIRLTGGSYQGPQDPSTVDIFIDRDGVIYGTHAIHGLLLLGRIDIVDFVNPGGLQQVGTSYFIDTLASGPPQVKIPMLESETIVLSGALEMSNVDLSQEFSDMIITQRGFQANSRIITVSDSMLEELVNLKR